MPPPNPPPGTAAPPALSARRILAPASIWSPVLVWETQPGATFVAGSRLGTLRSEPAIGAFATTADFLCLLVFLLTCGLLRLGRLAGERVLTAPEDGALLWLLEPAALRHLSRGEPLATYFPLAAWQAYEKLLRQQDAVIRGQQAAALPALRAEEARLAGEVAALRQQLNDRQQEGQRLLQGKLSDLTKELIRRGGEFDPAALSPTASHLFLQLARQIAAVLQQNYPLPLAEMRPLYDACLNSLLVIEERLRRLDVEFMSHYGQAPQAAEKEQILTLWKQRKAEMLKKFITAGQETSDLP